MAPLPSDETNPPNVKAIVSVPKGETFRAGEMFSRNLTISNKGGSGYYVLKTFLGRPGNSASSNDDVSWIGAHNHGVFERGGSFHVPEWDVGKTWVYEVWVWSGTSPINLILTDHHRYEWEIVK